MPLSDLDHSQALEVGGRQNVIPHPLCSPCCPAAIGHAHALQGVLDRAFADPEAHTAPLPGSDMEQTPFRPIIVQLQDDLFGLEKAFI